METFVPHPAVARGDLNKIKAWANHTKNIDELDEEEQTPLHVATQHNHSELAKFLLKKGASASIPDREGYSPLHYAALNQNLALCELLLLHKANPASRTNKGAGALNFILAVEAEEDHYLTVQKLIQNFLKHGADPNAEDEIGYTPLHLAAAHSTPHVLHMLIEAKAQVDQQASDGETPAHASVRHNRPDNFQEIRRAGGNINMKNKEGATLLDVAQENHPSLVPIIQEANRKQVPWRVVDAKGKWPIPRCNASSAVFNNRLYVFGGENDFFQPTSLYQDLAFWNGETMEWQCLSCRGDAPPPLCRHSASLLESRMFVFGGCGSGGKYYCTLRVLDLQTMTWSIFKPEGPYMISPRAGHTATTLSDSQFLVFGGTNGENYYNDVHLFDLNSSQWIAVDITNPSEAPAPRHHHTASVIGDRLYVYGGCNATDEFSDIKALDLTTWTWHNINTSGVGPGVRFGHASIVINERLFLVYGGADYDGKARADLHAFDTVTSRWIKYDSLSSESRQPFQRIGHSLSLVKYRIIAYGGNPMFTLHELLPHVLDAQAIVEAENQPLAPPKPEPRTAGKKPPMPPQVSGGDPARASKIIADLQENVTALTHILKEQMGFSEQSEVMKRCLRIQELSSELSDSSPSSSSGGEKARVLIRARKPTISVAGENVAPTLPLKSVSQPHIPPKPTNPFDDNEKPPVPSKPSDISDTLRSKHQSLLSRPIQTSASASSTPPVQRRSLYMGGSPTSHDAIASIVPAGQPFPVEERSRSATVDVPPTRKPRPKSIVLTLQEELPTEPTEPLRYYHKLLKLIPPKPTFEITIQNDKQKQFYEIFNELVNTEENYLRSLVVIIGLYKKPLEKIHTQVVLDHYMPLLFSNVEELFEVNLKFFKQLIRSPTSPAVGEAFATVQKDLIKYNTYCTNQSNALETVQRLIETNSDFSAFIQGVKEMPESRQEDLASYLTKPFQRVTRYPLLIGQLIKYASKSSGEHGKLTAVKQYIDQIVQQANEAKRLIDSVVKMIEVQSSFTWQGDEGQIKFSKDCKYILEGKFKNLDVKTQKTSRRHFFLFSDMVVIAKSVGKKYKKLEVIPLDSCIIWDIKPGAPELPKSISNAFTLVRTDNPDRLVMCASNEIEKEHWIASINSAISAFLTPDIRRSIE